MSSTSAYRNSWSNQAHSSPRSSRATLSACSRAMLPRPETPTTNPRHPRKIAASAPTSCVTKGTGAAAVAVDVAGVTSHRRQGSTRASRSRFGSDSVRCGRRRQAWYEAGAPGNAMACAARAETIMASRRARCFSCGVRAFIRAANSRASRAVVGSANGSTRSEHTTLQARPPTIKLNGSFVMMLGSSDFAARLTCRPRFADSFPVVGGSEIATDAHAVPGLEQVLGDDLRVLENESADRTRPASVGTTGASEMEPDDHRPREDRAPTVPAPREDGATRRRRRAGA